MKWWYASAANLLALPLLPWLLVQGRRTRQNTPRLPPAAGACSGLVGIPTARPLRLLTVGESPVAGVGVARQEQAITACLASSLAELSQCAIHWQALGQNGATVADAISDLLPQLPAQTQDVVVLAFGVNDTSAFHSMRRFERDLRYLMQALLNHCKPQLLILSGLPPIGRLPALPQPLRTVLGYKAQALDAVTRELILEFPSSQTLVHAPIQLALNDPALIATDGYHPSALACQLWGQALAQLVKQHLPLPQN